jgi:hypothetical protein
MRAHTTSVLLLGILVASLTACAVPFAHVPRSDWTTAPEPDKALVCIVYAGSGWGGTFAYVFMEDASGQDRYVGTLFQKTRLTLQLDPGTYLLSVVGETVDLMRVTVEAGNTYHGIVVDYLAPSAAVMRNSYGHYRFEAINDPNDTRLPQWSAAFSEVVPSDKGRAEAAGHLKRLAKMKPEYLPRWEAKDEPQHVYVPTPHPPASTN